MGQCELGQGREGTVGRLGLYWRGKLQQCSEG